MLMSENEKKIKMLQDRIKGIEESNRFGNWYNLTESEKEAAINNRRRWKETRIAELVQEIKKLKEQ